MIVLNQSKCYSAVSRSESDGLRHMCVTMRLYLITETVIKPFITFMTEKDQVDARGRWGKEAQGRPVLSWFRSDLFYVLFEVNRAPTNTNQIQAL